MGLCAFCGADPPTHRLHLPKSFLTFADFPAAKSPSRRMNQPGGIWRTKPYRRRREVSEARSGQHTRIWLAPLPLALEPLSGMQLSGAAFAGLVANRSRDDSARYASDGPLVQSADGTERSHSPNRSERAPGPYGISQRNDMRHWNASARGQPIAGWRTARTGGEFRRTVIDGSPPNTDWVLSCRDNQTRRVVTVATGRCCRRLINKRLDHSGKSTAGNPEAWGRPSG